MAGGLIGGLLGAIVGGGSTPKVDTAGALAPVVEDQNLAKKARQALLETTGGIQGAELTPSQVKQRDTLFGN
jgi:outer membrane lipoprotein SlyB